MLRRFVKALTVGAALASTSAMAAVPLQMNVQGSLLNADGSPVSGTYSIAFTLYSGAGAGASSVWSETIADVAASEGVFDEVLGGAGTPLQASAFTGNPQLWLGMTVVAGPGVPAGGQPELPRRPLATVAYAFESHHAVSAGTADNLSCASGCVSLSELGFDVATQAELDAAIAQPATSALDLQCSSCVSTSELNFDVATQAELDAAVTAAASAVLTVSNSLNSTNDNLNALTNRVTAAEAAITTLQGKTALSDLACAAGKIAVSSGAGVWACGDAPASTPSAACQGDHKALQWDGAAWKCVSILETGLSSGNAKGFEARDSWGLIWDGVERQAATWDNAKAYCESKGGRLPTATELYRVSAAQFSEVGTPYETNWLWAYTPWEVNGSTNRHVLVRFNQTDKTNAVSYGDDTSLSYSYRCVWPNNTTQLFTGNNCYGPAGSECFQAVGEGKRFNIDAYDRPTISYVGAVWECEFYGAHVPTTRHWAENIRNGLPNGTNEWLWSSDYTRYDLTDIIRWSGVNPAGWDAGYASYLSWDSRPANNRRFFRCMGLGYAPGPNPNPTPADTITWGQKWTGGSTANVSHEKQLGAKTYHEASDDCFARGGHIPHTRDWMEMIRAGLPNGPGTTADTHYTWTSDFTFYQNAEIIRWLGVDAKYTSNYSTYATWSSVNTTTRPYRCNWYPIDEAYAGPANNKCNAGQFDCFASANGGTVKTKTWVDPVDRPNGRWADAVADCADEGGHLMSTREYIEQIRAGLPNGTGPNWYWTSDSAGNDGTNPGLAVITRWNGTNTAWVPGTTFKVGATNYSSLDWAYRQTVANVYTYRCAWSNELW